MVRAKYPGAYDDLDDASLDRMVRQKYPGAYDDIPAKSETKDEAALRLANSRFTVNPDLDAWKRRGGAFVDRGVEMAKGLGSLGLDAAKSALTLEGQVGFLPRMAKNAYEGMIDSSAEAINRQTSPERKGLAAVPVIGPYAMNVLSDYEEGKGPEAEGRMAADALSMLIPGSKAGRGATGAAIRLADGKILKPITKGLTPLVKRGAEMGVEMAPEAIGAVAGGALGGPTGAAAGALSGKALKDAYRAVKPAPKRYSYEYWDAEAKKNIADAEKLLDASKDPSHPMRKFESPSELLKRRERMLEDAEKYRKEAVQVSETTKKANQISLKDDTPDPWADVWKDLGVNPPEPMPIELGKVPTRLKVPDDRLISSTPKGVDRIKAAVEAGPRGNAAKKAMREAKEAKAAKAEAAQAKKDAGKAKFEAAKEAAKPKAEAPKADKSPTVTVPGGETVRLYRVESKDLGDRGEWLSKHLTPKQFETFKSERGRLFGDNPKSLENYGWGLPEKNSFYVDVPKNIADSIKRRHPDGFDEFLLPEEFVSKKRLIEGGAVSEGALFDATTGKPVKLTPEQAKAAVDELPWNKGKGEKTSAQPASGPKADEGWGGGKDSGLVSGGQVNIEGKYAINPDPSAKTRLDLMLDSVERTGKELTIEVDGATPEIIRRVMDSAGRRDGVSASTDGRFVLLRKKAEKTPAQAKFDKAKSDRLMKQVDEAISPNAAYEILKKHGIEGKKIPDSDARAIVDAVWTKKDSTYQSIEQWMDARKEKWNKMRHKKGTP